MLILEKDVKDGPIKARPKSGKGPTVPTNILRDFISKSSRVTVTSKHVEPAAFKATDDLVQAQLDQSASIPQPLPNLQDFQLTAASDEDDQVFTKKRGKARGPPTVRYWDLQSSARGCSMCQLLWQALQRSDTLRRERVDRSSSEGVEYASDGITDIEQAYPSLDIVITLHLVREKLPLPAFIVINFMPWPLKMGAHIVHQEAVMIYTHFGLFLAHNYTTNTDEIIDTPFSKGLGMKQDSRLGVCQKFELMKSWITKDATPSSVVEESLPRRLLDLTMIHVDSTLLDLTPTGFIQLVNLVEPDI